MDMVKHPSTLVKNGGIVWRDTIIVFDKAIFASCVVAIIAIPCSVITY